MQEGWSMGNVQPYFSRINLVVDEEIYKSQVNFYIHKSLQNVISAMRVLLDARAKLKLDWEDESRSVHAEHFTKLVLFKMLGFLKVLIL